MAKNQLPSLETLIQNHESLYGVLNEEEDFVCVMIVGGYLDRCLAALLTKHLAPGSTTDRLLSERGILGTFQSRVDICYCLGFIPKEDKQNLQLVGQIRNAFGHSYKLIDFGHADIMAHCNQIRFPKPDAYTVFGGEPNPDGPFADVRNPRSKFCIIATFLISSLLLRSLPNPPQQSASEAGDNATAASD